MNVMGVIDSINKPNRVEGDYIKDGLLYCGQCHTPKQCRCDDSFLSGKPLNINCMCAEEALKREQEAERRRKIEDKRKMFLPLERMRNSTFENAETSKTISVAEKYVENWEVMRANGDGLVFYGNVGTGKSYAALCIANALIDRDIAVKYISAADIISKLMSRDTNQEEFIKSLCVAPLLIIDDLGAEHDSSYSQAQMCRVIDARIESGKPFICTTNYSLQDMEETNDHLRQRIFDRVRGVCVPVIVDGQSRRKGESTARLQRARQLLQ